MNDTSIKTLLMTTPEIREILTIIAQLGLKDTWLCAGAIRNLIWQALSDQPAFDRTTDVDVIFYDPEISYEMTQVIEAELKSTYPHFAWEVKNQAHMHWHNPGTLPYTSACDAMSKFPETCTAIGARLISDSELELFHPYGLADIVNFVVRPTPFFAENAEKLAIYRERQAQKKWQEKWPQLQILAMN